MSANDTLYARARRTIPGGVNSPVRAFRAVGGAPRSLVAARGPHVTDADGTRYVDLVGGWGPAILGHAHPEVVAAVADAASRGLAFGASSPGETELAELIVQRVGPVEMVRLVSTGTEATMTAVRLARAATGRDLVVTFAGNYHGHSDGLLAEAGSGVATAGLPGSAGVPAPIAALTIVVPYNDPAALAAVFERHPDGIAAVMAEAAPANMGVVPPAPGFTAEISRLCRAHGALFISDEVLTGFRVSAAGHWGLAPDVAPDLLTFGKIVGGGLPVAAVAGRRDVMSMLAPEGPVYQAGTLSGNPVAVASGLATLRRCDAEVYARVDAASDLLRAEVATALEGAGVPHVIQRAGNLFSVFFGDAVTGGVPDYATAKRQDTHRFAAFFQSMLAQGVWLPPSAFEAWFLSAAHDDEALGAVVAALPAAARAAAGAVGPAAR